MAICKVCNKEKYVWTDGICSPCHTKIKQDKIKQDFDEFYADAEEDEEFDTSSGDFVICPHCGYAIPTDFGYEDFPELYEEGEHKITCPECDKDFVMETSISYYYETRKEEDL